MTNFSSATLRPLARWPWQRHLHYRIVLIFGMLFLVVLLLLMIYVGRVVYDVQFDQAEHALEVQAFLAANSLEDPLSGYAPEFDELERKEEEGEQDNEDEDSESDEGESSDQTAQNSEASRSGGVASPLRLQQIAEWYAADSHTRVTIFDAQGRALADSSYARIHVPNELDQPEVQAALASIEQHDIRADYFSGETTLFIAAPIRQGNRVLGTVRMSQPMDRVVAPARMLLMNLALAGLVAMAMVTALGLWSGRRLVAPLRQLEVTALAVGGGDLTQQALVDSSDEIGALADAFNYMMEALRRLIDSQRTFIANASHELRTPLANIKLRSEALIDIGDEDPALTKRYIREIDGEADRLGRLANTLLDMARMEALSRAPIGEAVDISPTLLSVARTMRLRMRQAKLTFITRIPTELPPLAIWKDQLEAIVLNLLDNAIRYTPPSGEVRFDVSVKEGECILRVQDNGPGIPAEDLPYIFDRFYRVDKARSRQSSHLGMGSGAGLGLSIVKALVEGNGGSLRVESTPGHGTIFIVSFPTV